MGNLCFLAVLWLVHGTALGFEDAHSNGIVTSDLESEFDRIVEDYLSSLSMAHSRTQSRSKRDLTPGLKSLLIDDKGVYRLQTVTPVSHLCYPALFSQFIDVENDTYAVCVSAGMNGHLAEVIVGLYKDRKWIPQNRWYMNNPNGLAAFYYNGYIYVLVADMSREGVDLVRINIKSKEMVMDHTVSSNYATSISIWEMKVDGTFHMAISNSPRHKDPSDFRTEVFIYKWKDTYYDRYAILQASDVKDIEPFHIHGAAYLAFANFRRGNLNYDADSEILQYDLDSKSWVSHQKIRTYGATDWEFFTLGSSLSREFYLAVANKESNKEYKGISDAASVIYKFVKDQFVPFQCLPTPNAFSIASLSTEDGYFLLAVASFDAVHLYQYDGWNFVLSSTQYTQGSMSYGSNHLVFHSIVRGTARVPILGVSNPRHPRDLSIYEMGFHNENYLRSWNEKSTEWCLNTMNRVESSSTESVISLMDDVIFTDQPAPIVINGSLVFANGFETEKLKTPQLKEILTEEIYDNNMLDTLKLLRGRLREMSMKLDDFDAVLQNAFKIDGDQTIHGRLEFQDVSFDCEGKSCSFTSLNTSILNGEEIGNWANNLVFLDREQLIDGPIFAEKIYADNIIVHGMIDGVNSRDLVTKSGSHNITGPKTFESLVTVTDIKVDGLVDGVKISPTNVLLTTSYQNVTGHLTFENVEASWLDVNGLVNGIDLPKFYKDVVLSDQPANVAGEKTFRDIIVSDLIMTPGSTINGIDVIDLWKNALWTEDFQEIKAPMTFESVTMLKNLKVPLGVNEIEIPGPRIVDINNPATVTEHHFFKQSTKIAQLNILESLNEIGSYKVPGKLPQLDIMLKTGDQVVTGKKTFHTIHLDADSYVKGTVDGVDLSKFKSLVLHRNPLVDSNRTWVFNNLVIKGSLTANKINGYSLDYIYENALKLADEDIPEIIFKKIVHIKELESRNINGLDIENDLVLLNKDQVLTGDKEFNNIVLEENSLILGHVNNINLSFLNETILRVGNQVLRSKVFNRNVKFNKLTVTGSINSIPVADIATVSGTELLHTRLLQNVSFDAIEANSLEVTGTVNNIDVEGMITDTMTYDDYQTVRGKKTIKETIHLDKSNHLTVGDINGVNIRDLWDDSVLLDVPQNVSGTKIFENSVTFDHLIFKRTIDGVSEKDMKNWMLKDKPQVVEGNVVFLRTISTKNLNVKGYVNNLNITELDYLVVNVNEPNVIEGPITFENLVISSGNVTLSGKIQGVKISEESVTKFDDKLITGIKTFAQDLVVEGNAFVDGSIDGVLVEDVCRRSLLMNKEQSISHLTIKGDVVLSGGGTIKGKVGGVDLSDLQKIHVGAELNVTGKKTFRSIAIEGLVTVEGLFGGVNLEILNKTYMSLTRDQEIPAQMEFEDVTFRNTLHADKFSTLNKMVNGEDLSKINDRILLKSGQQNVTAQHYFDEVTFVDDVFVAGKVNGLNVPGGLMRRNVPNFIQSPKMFAKPVTINENLMMQDGRKINNVDVSDWSNKAVLKTGGTFQIDGLKTFEGLEITDAKIEGLLDGLSISEKALLMSYGDQLIRGRKTIKGDVEVKGPVTLYGLLNGINVTTLDSKTLQRNRSSLVTGFKNFAAPLTIQDLQAHTVDGVNVEELQNKIHHHLDFGDLQTKLDEIRRVIGNMEEAISKQAVVFQYYELFQAFGIPSAYNWLYISGEDCGELLLLSEESNAEGQCSKIVIYQYDQSMDKFLPFSKELSTSYAVSVKSLYVWNTTYLFVANQNAHRCSDAGTSLGRISGDVYEWTGDRFVLFQGIETSSLEDMAIFYDGNVCCIVYLALHESKVYCSKGKDLQFEEFGLLQTKGAKKASIINSHGVVILAVVVENLDPTNGYIEKKPVEIFFWNSADSVFELRTGPIMSTYAQSVQLMSYHTEQSSVIFLAIAEGRVPKVKNEPKILIYRYEAWSEQFQKYQEIQDYGDLEWIVLETGELILFALDSYVDKIKLYQYKGASGFVNIDSVNSVGSTSLHPFIRHEDPSDNINHYLALAGPRGLATQPSHGEDYAKILKSKVKGRRPY